MTNETVLRDFVVQQELIKQIVIVEMVFFVCEGCNESMKKNQVDKHAARCRGCHAVTCVDCSVTFYGNDYATHLTCVSEAEKYEKTLYKAKVVTKLNPQEAWTALIEEAATRSEEAPKQIRDNVRRLNDLGNVPRNKNKFVNFVKNSMKIHNTNVIEEIWNFLEKLKEQKNGDKALTAPKAEIKNEAETDKAESLVEIPSKVEESNTEEEMDNENKKKEKKARKAERKRIRESTIEIEDKDETVVEDDVKLIDDEKKKSKKNKKQKQESA
jgi:cell growth-regulating nucleolar protein